MTRHSKPRDTGFAALSPVRTESAREPKTASSSQQSKRQTPESCPSFKRHPRRQHRQTPRGAFLTYYDQRAALTLQEPEVDATPVSATTEVGAPVAVAPEVPVVVGPALFEGHREFQENQRGISYETLLLSYLREATEITIIDPYIRLPHQGRNLVDLLALLASAKDIADEIGVTLVTKAETGQYEEAHLLMLKDIQDGASAAGINFTVTWDETIHDRSIRADNGWTILLGRGLDIFQQGSGRQCDVAARRQEIRQVVAFGVTRGGRAVRTWAALMSGADGSVQLKFRRVTRHAPVVAVES